MPVYQITAPDGKTYKVQGPAGASDAQVRAEVLRQFPNAGKRAAPKPKEQPSTLGQLWNATKNTVAGAVQGIASIPDVTTEAIAGGMRLGTRAIGAGGGAILDATGNPEAANRFRADAARYDHALAQPFTIARAVEKVAPTPQDTAGKTVRTLSQFAGGAAVPMPAPKPTVSLATATKAAPSIRAAQAQAGQEIADEGAKRGVTVMTSDVLPPQTSIGKLTQSISEKIPFVGTGGNRAVQQGQRQAAIKDFATAAGANEAALADTAADLTSKRSADIARLSGDKKAVIDAVEGVVPVENATAAIDQQIARLTGLKSAEYKPIIAKLQDWKQAIQGQSLVNIEALRKQMGETFKAPELANVRSIGEDALSAIYGPLKDDMGAAIKASQGDEALSRWAGANEQLSEMAGELGSGKLRRVLSTADMTPENVSSLLFSNKPSEVALLYKGLTPQGKSRAQGAILQRAVEKAGGIDDISPAKFLAEIKRLGKSTGIVFEGDEAARLNGLQRLLEATARAGKANVLPDTGVQNLPVAAGYTLGSLFGTAAIPVATGAGLLARAYESAPVRDLLLKLARTAPGSRNEANLLRQLTPALSAVAANNNEAAASSLVAKVGVPLAASDGEEDE